MYLEKKNTILDAFAATEKKLENVIQSTETRVLHSQRRANKYSKEIQNILNEQTKVTELPFQGKNYRE